MEAEKGVQIPRRNNHVIAIRMLSPPPFQWTRARRFGEAINVIGFRAAPRGPGVATDRQSGAVMCAMACIPVAYRLYAASMSATCPQSAPDLPVSAADTAPKKRRRRDPNAKRFAIAGLDFRTREGRMVKQLREQLVAHVGGKPSATQGLLIEQAVQLQLRLAALDAAFADTGEMSLHASRSYLAWANSLTRLLRQLGLRGAAAKAPTIAEIFAAPNPSRPA